MKGKIRFVIAYITSSVMWVLMHLFRICSVKNNKVVASAVRGRKYADNPRYIVEELMHRNRNFDIVWLKRKDYEYEVPDGIRTVNNLRNYIQLAYEYSTARVIIMSHHAPQYFRKRKGQLFIQTWHGGLGIKKIELDAEKFIASSRHEMAELKATVKSADVFISNSDHLSRLYRSAFEYKGPIFKSGYPKNDCLFYDKTIFRKRVREQLGFSLDTILVTYAPTFRDSARKSGYWQPDASVYDMDFERVYQAFKKRLSKNCVVLIKMHPNLQGTLSFSDKINDHVKDITWYNDMQDLISASDYFISDYSSCIFDAATAGIPCFTYAKDFEEYKADRGVYYEMEELPFPYARDNDEMEANILNFNQEEYNEKWKAFTVRTGLNETGHAAKDIADKICDILDGKQVEWNNSEI